MKVTKLRLKPSSDGDRRTGSASLLGRALLAMLAAVPAACGDPAPPVAGDGVGGEYVSVLPLTTESYRVVEMASAHGALAIEVEVAADADVEAIAHELIDPVRDRYAEILVYFHDREVERAAPVARAEWTPSQGYSLTWYDER